jgi:hypothetical protein
MDRRGSLRRFGVCSLRGVIVVTVRAAFAARIPPDPGFAVETPDRAAAPGALGP